jgi:hypothetical protein
MIRLSILILLLTIFPYADRVFVKNGTILEGDIIAKSSAIIKIFIDVYQRPIAIEKNYIDSIDYKGRIFTFEQLQLEEKTDYNPAFKVSPIVRKVNPRAVQELFASDPFETARKNNYNSDSRKQNLLFNAPSRWGSAGMGYALSTKLSSTGGGEFNYNGRFFEIRSLLLSMRYNLGRKAKMPGTIVAEFGYGKAHLDTVGLYPEIAIMRHLSFRYVLCNPKWLLSPGVSIGVLLRNGSITKSVPQDLLSVVVFQDRTFKDSSAQPFIGADLNIYDVMALHISYPFFAGNSNGLYSSLLFLIPFRL